ncbi:hypothetical protein GCM10010266_42870 [Streptomyces griseomycini]|nr:hypothetical protein GCM10010266_42870 [Streptomyces griseomycini]GGR25077.1 hypothetical protein GCM10015536_33520 [Streptomyces griseomycini]
MPFGVYRPRFPASAGPLLASDSPAADRARHLRAPRTARAAGAGHGGPSAVAAAGVPLGPVSAGVPGLLVWATADLVGRVGA